MSTYPPKAPDFVAHHAKSRPAKLACHDLDTGLTFTYAELDARVGQFVRRLSPLVSPGDRVAMIARNRTDIIAVQWACVRLGAFFAPMNWRLSPAELALLGKDCTPAAALFEDEFSVAAEALGCPTLRLDEPAPEQHPASRGPFAADQVATLLYTSGTTGRPKGVIFTELNALYSTLNFTALAQVGPDSVLLCDAPLFHTIGLYALSRSAIQAGASVLYSARFDPALTYQRLTDPKLGVTHYMAAPQMVEALRAAPDFQAVRLAHLTAIATGGAPYPPEQVRAWATAGVRVVHGYGMSETGTALCMPLEPGQIAEKAGASGLPGPAIEMRLVTPEGMDAEGEAPGEIWMRGGGVSPGYWKNPEATAAAYQGGWLKSGDVAWRDSDGVFHICDRLKDMYISGGENVYPAEVEAVLLAHEGVRDAAVVGISDAQWGEVGAAFIVGDAADDTLVAHCRARLAGYKIPKRFIYQQALPRTLSGKVQKHVLRQIIKSET